MRGILLMFVFAILAGTAAYFGTKTVVLQGKLDKITSKTTSAPAKSSPATGVATSEKPTLNPIATSTSTAAPVTAPDVAAKDRLSQPAQTYTVADGDTLSAIATEHGMRFSKIAEVNNLSDPYPLKIGQILLIPEVDKDTGIVSVAFTFDTAKAQKEQTAVDNGTNTWRLDPVATAAAEIGGAFGLARSDDFRILTKDEAAGTATVAASRLVGSSVVSYDISLRQPLTKGAGGIWVIVRVSSKK